MDRFGTKTQFYKFLSISIIFYTQHLSECRPESAQKKKKMAYSKRFLGHDRDGARLPADLRGSLTSGMYIYAARTKAL